MLLLLMKNVSNEAKERAAMSYDSIDLCKAVSNRRSGCFEMVKAIHRLTLSRMSHSS